MAYRIFTIPIAVPESGIRELLRSSPPPRLRPVERMILQYMPTEP
jgi:hypothetical protein